MRRFCVATAMVCILLAIGMAGAEYAPIIRLCVGMMYMCAAAACARVAGVLGNGGTM